MRVGVVGTGYVGAVQGAGLAHLGHEVTSVDIDPAKVEMLNRGELPIFEPGLQELVVSGLREGRLNYTTDFNQLAQNEVEVIFFCVPTPPNDDGSADLTYLKAAAKSAAQVVKADTVFVNKSTVPAGSVQLVADHIQPFVREGVSISVVSNPEFLREGTAVEDFMNPNGIIIGANSDHAFALLRKVYASFGTDSLFETDPASAEMIKYARNGFRAVKLSFINNIAEIARGLGANVDDIVKAMKLDPVIGEHFVQPGPGWGGSCFPKDSRALEQIARSVGVDFAQMRSTLQDNERHKSHLAKQVIDHFEGDVSNKTFALWGAAFKANTDDIRESPAIVVAEQLSAAGARVVIYDPEAIANASKHFTGNEAVSFAEEAYAATKGADGLVIATEWPEFASPSIGKLSELLAGRVVFDGRNLFDPRDNSSESVVSDMVRFGFIYKSFGRKGINE